MTITGKIELIEETKQVSASFKKRGVVIKTAEEYPQEIMIEFTQDGVDKLNGFSEGQQVEVSINIRGRKWESPQGEVKYFNTIQGWKII